MLPVLKLGQQFSSLVSAERAKMERGGRQQHICKHWAETRQNKLTNKLTKENQQ